MKKICIKLISFLVFCVSTHAAVNVDFNDSTIGENLSAANLNAGSLGAAWTVIQAGNVSSAGSGGQEKVQGYSDAPSDNQLQLDGPRLNNDGGSRSTPFDYQLDFDSEIVLGGGQTLSFDAICRRAGAGEGSARNGLIIGYDSSGNTLFELIIDGVNTDSRGTIGLSGQPRSSEKVNFFDPSLKPAVTRLVNISIELGVSSFDVIVGGKIAYSKKSYADSVSELSGLRFTASGPDAGYAGYSIDNIKILFKASNPAPADGDAGAEPANLNENGFCWDVPATADVTGCWLYVNVNDPNLGDISPEFVASAGGKVCYLPESLTFDLDQTIYWRVDTQFNNSGPIPGDPNTIEGVLWSFKTQKTIPSIDVNPANVTVFPAAHPDYEGDPGFACEFTSLSTPTVVWNKDGDFYENSTAVPNGSDSYISTLTIIGAEVNNEGTYECIVYNDSGPHLAVTSEGADLLIKRQTAHWKFDGDYTDDLGNFDLALGDPNYASVAFTDGLLSQGQAIEPNGFDQYLKSTQSEPLDYFAGYTFTLWTKTGNAGQSYDGILATGPGGFQIDVLDSNFRFAAMGGNGQFGPVITDKRTFLALSFDGSQVTLYKDGLVSGVRLDQPEFLQVLDIIQIAANRSGTIVYEGVIDDVQMYNYPLTQADIIDIMFSETGTVVCDPARQNVFDISGPVDAPDCVVDIYDFALFAGQWLDCTLLPATECP